jgi:hypothetical protein
MKELLETLDMQQIGMHWSRHSAYQILKAANEVCISHRNLASYKVFLTQGMLRMAYVLAHGNI